MDPYHPGWAQEGSAGADGKADRQRLCRACGRFLSKEKKILTCAACRIISYCNTQCQTAHWPQHKPACREKVRVTKQMAAVGMDPRRKNDIMGWFLAMPELCHKLACLAWHHREDNPWIQVVGGPDGKVAKFQIITRDMWDGECDNGTAMGYAARFAQADFDKDRHYFLEIGANHPGSETWPKCAPRMVFSFPPQVMDGIVQIFFEQNVAERVYHRRTVVMLRGLRSEELNGKMGVRVAYDNEKRRFHVRLDNGKVLSVKRDNIGLLEA